MTLKNDKEISPKKTSLDKDDVVDLKQFVQKKKNQNDALKKILDKLNQ